MSEEKINKEHDNPKKESFSGPLFGKSMANITGVILLLTGFFGLFTSFWFGLLIFVSGLIIFPKSFCFLSKKTNKSLSKKARILTALGLIVVASITNTDSSSNEIKPKINNNGSKQEVVEKQEAEETETKPAPTESNIVKEPVKQIESEPKPTTKVETTIEPTLGEKQAVLSAKNYLNYTAFSRKGLIEQLEYEGFTYQQAEYGVDQINADWDEQAYLSAKNYIEYTAFSRSGLIDQLVYEGFTRQQAEYGVTSIGY